MKRVFLVLKFTPLGKKPSPGFLTGFILPLFFLIVVTDGFASDQKLPLIDGKEIVAMVNDEPITLEEFNRALVFLHTAMPEKKEVGSIDYSEILNRLINTRLILLEAGNIGLDEFPEIKNMVDKYSGRTLLELLLKEYVKDIKADEEEVDKLYKKTVKEWKIKSVMFEKENDAKKMEEEIKAGNNFDEIAERVIADGTVRGSGEGEYLKGKELLPQIAEVVSTMEIGSVSHVIQVGQGFVILKLEDIRFPENPEAREQARQEALNRKRVQAARDYDRDLKKRYVKMHEKLLDALDYESKEPGFEKLLKDKRVLAEVKGEKPVTVGELTEALKQKFYHGVERAVEGKKLNERKRALMEEILQKRVFRKEALKQGIDKREAYKNMVKEYENSVIFGAFIQKVVVPDIKLSVEELKAYYNENIGEYAYPEMMRIKSLVFEKNSDAEGAIDILRKGTDFKWLSANAGGQVEKDIKGLLKFEGRVLTLKGLPEKVQKAVSGANPGDFRLYASHEGHFYVLYIQEVVPSKPQPFEKVKEEIAKKVFNDKIKKAVEGWADKLREFYDVKIYKTDLK